MLPPRGPERIEFEERALDRCELVFRENVDAGGWHLGGRLLGGLPDRLFGELFGGHVFPHGDVWGG